METAPASETAPRVKDPTPRIKVQERDIVQLAFGKCKRCQGTGYMTFVRQMMAKKGSVMYRNAKGEPTRFYERDTKVPIVNPIHNRFGMVNEESGKTNFVRRESDPGERDKEVCACAIARFVRLQATDIDPETNELYFAEPLHHITQQTKDEHEAIIKTIAAREAAAKGESNVGTGSDVGSGEGGSVAAE